jgi:hypothetical protein
MTPAHIHPKKMSIFEQFMLLALVCFGIFYMSYEYNSRKLEAIQKKREEDEKIMAALRKEYEPKRPPPRRFPIY